MAKAQKQVPAPVPSPSPSSTPSAKFALYDYSGNPLEFVRVEREDLGGAAATSAAALSDLILIFDRSGSMYGAIEDVKASALKTLTLSEFNDPNLRVSLITYSSKGDVKLHFHRVTVADIMATDSLYQREIRSLRATSLTCISQSLEMVDGLIDDARLTGVLLHTDGCANDASPVSEKRALDAVSVKLRRHPKLFVNAVAHGAWADTNLLMQLAGALSGRMLQAHDQRGIYTALHDTTALLAGAQSPVIEIGLGSANYAIFVSRADKKILGSADKLTVRGLSSTGDKTAYRLHWITASEYDQLRVPVCGEGADLEPVTAYARSMLAEGKPLRAKYALMATRHRDLIRDHAKAMVPSALARFADDLETATLSPTPYTPQASYGIGTKGPSVLRVLTTLQKYRDGIELNLSAFASQYKRRGLRRVAGARDSAGQLVPPTVESRMRDVGPWVRVNGFEANRDTATVNMLVSRPIDLYKDGVKVEKVAGQKLDQLTSYNNYTIVGAGELNAPRLPLRLQDKQALRALRDLGIAQGTYTPGMEVEIDLAPLPLVDYDQTFTDIPRDTVEELFRLTAVGKFLAGVAKGESTSLTGEQIAELKTHYLTPALYFSPPTTTEYTTLPEALASGQVDTRLDYAIGVGLPSITAATKLPSGNAFLQRRFTLEVNGKEQEKPTLDQIGTLTAKWGIKKLSARTVLTAIDALVFPLYAGLLGLASSAELDATLQLAGVSRAELVAALTGADRESAVAAAAEASRAVESAVEAVYDIIRPLAFYIGASGIVPDSLNAKAMGVEEIEKAYPEAKLSKAEKDDGMFYLLPSGVLLTVYVRAEYFSTAPVSTSAAA